MMTNSCRRFLASLPILFVATSLFAQQAKPATQAAASQPTSQAAAERTQQQREDYRKAMEEADQKIAVEVKAHSELMRNLEYLTTQIGPRLTGSPQMQAASDWTLKRFKDYGV